MPAGNPRLIYDGNGDGTGSWEVFQRRRRDVGQVKVEFTPNSSPGTVTVKIQTSADQGRNDSNPTTVKTFSEVELGTTGGTALEQMILGPSMRVDVSNNDDSLNNVKVWVFE